MLLLLLLLSQTAESTLLYSTVTNIE